TDNYLSQLKKIIKEEGRPQFDNIASYELILWHVNVDISAINAINDMLSDENKLITSTNTIGETFFNIEGRNIRVVIGIPVVEQAVAAESSKRQYSVNNYEEEQRRSVKKIRKYPSPSSFAHINYLHEYQNYEQEFLIYRPSGCICIPLMLYNSAFFRFKRYFDDKDLPMDKDHYQWTINCIKTMANLYPDEKFRQREFHERIRELFNKDVKILQLEDKTSNDGVLELYIHSINILYLLIKITNEIGTGKCDPTIQAAAFYAKFYAQNKYEKILKGCNVPCFIIVLAGPWICVLGAVYVEKPLIEPLTSFEPLILTNDRIHLEKIARLFMALRLGCDNLMKYYESLSDSILNVVDYQRFFPYIRTANNVGDFVYKEKLFNDPHKLLWKAETKRGQTIIVKFSHKYNAYAHEVCHEIGKAPELFFVSNMDNGFCMIIMGYIEGQKLRDCDDLSFSEYKKIINDIEIAISHLHSKNIVFADLRDSNILVIKDDKIYHGMLIDFDWA
ncbi:15719_t:CDS:2, partial [Racocetra persica]